MDHKVNHLQQPVGLKIEGWVPPPIPSRDPMEGHFCRLEFLDANKHADDLFAANSLDTEGRMWTYLLSGPFANPGEYKAWINEKSRGDDPIFFAVIDKTNHKPVGMASYMRIDRVNGSIEVGGIAYSPLLQRTPAATEAMYLMMAKAFELGYRRYEWKCDSLNAPSRVAAERFGFTFEGILRQAVIVRGRNRDTAWYSITDTEWPSIKEAFIQWLHPNNFDEQGNQKASLKELREKVKRI